MGKANYGYCCINLTLQKDHDIKIGRSMIKRTFTAKGIKYAGELAEANIRDLVEIIKWNHKKGINVYRMSSSMFPWMSEYQLTDLPNWKTISNLLKGAGTLVQKYNQRIGFHPGQFCVLPSPTPKTVTSAIRELDQAAFDYHHHRCYEDPMSEEDALKLCATTWPKGIRQLCHYSSSKKLNEDDSVILRAHADYVYEKIETYDMDIDIELEVKAKELALLKYRKEYLDSVLS